MSLTCIERLETYLRANVGSPIHAAFASTDSGRLLLESWISMTSIIKHIKEHPPIYTEGMGDGQRMEIFVRLPYFEPVTLDVFVFSVSAVAFRIYMFSRGWAKKRAQKHAKTKKQSSPVKAKRVEGYQDTNLQKTMKECQKVKQQLRKVEDPELARKKKQTRLKYSSDGNGGFLGMSRDSLQKARNDLKHVNNQIKQQ